jgi:hypothetical protein
MKNLFIRLLLVFAIIIAYQTCAGAGAAAPKIAIHIEKYAQRVCHENMPEITRGGITGTYEGVGRVNAFVVLYDYEEVLGAAFGLVWPETWSEPAWQDCGAMRLGTIHHPGDRTNVMFEKCSRGGEPVVVGWLTVTVTSPGTIELIPSEGEGAVAIVDCNHAMPGLSEVMFTARGGAGGAPGTELSRFLYMRNRTWQVRPDSSGDARSISHAIRQSIPGDTVAVAGGTYRETVNLRNGVVVMGSFNSDFTRRDLLTFPSTISGGREKTCVVGGLSEDSTCVMDGFVITGGQGNYGGGIALRNGSSPVLRNLIVYGNNAKLGGGIFCHASSPLIEDVLVVGNQAEMGGGIACNMGASPMITRATIAANKADTGGGVYARGASPSVERCIIAHHAGGAGIHCEKGASQVTFACTDLYDNRPSDFGGAAGPGMGLKDNISQDPMFADVAKMDFALSEGSPCKDLPGCGRLGTRWTSPPAD